MILGTVYLNFLETPLDVLKRDLALIKKSGLNTVVLWPPRHYDLKGNNIGFEENLKFMDLAQTFGLSVIVELLGQATFLEFFSSSEEKEEYLCKTPLQPNYEVLKRINYNHPFVREQVLQHIQECANAFKEHPALTGFDIYNETHHSTFDPYTLNLYRQYLMTKYQDIANLNRRWRTTYHSFNDVAFYVNTWQSVAPDIDREEFRRHNLTEIIRDFVQACKEAAPQIQTIADNVMAVTNLGSIARGTDDWMIADCVDTYGISFYVKTRGRIFEKEDHFQRCLTLETARSAAYPKPFIVSEMQTNTYNALKPDSSVEPADICTWIQECMDMGAHGIIFWKWKPFENGIQTGGRGLVKLNGGSSKKLHAIQKMKIQKQKVKAPSCGIYYSPTIENLVDSYLKHLKLFATKQNVNPRMYYDAIYGWYKGFHLAGKNVRFVHEDYVDRDLAGLQVLVIPYPIYLSTANTVKIQEFMSAGKTCIIENPVVFVDQNLFQKPSPLFQADIETYAIEDLEFHLQGILLQFASSQAVINSTDCEVIANSKSNGPSVLQKNRGKGRLTVYLGNLGEYFATEIDPKVKEAFESVILG